jgi:hypothetical protein
MKQPWIAPATMGGSIVTGVAAMVVGGYKIADCLRYQAGPGVCDQVVEANALAVVGGVAAIAGPIGGLFTYNEKLEAPGGGRRRRRRDDEPEPGPPVMEPGPVDLAVIDRDPRVTFAVPEPPAPPAPPPAPAIKELKDPWLDDDAIDRQINLLSEDGWTQQRIADHLDVTLYRVRKALGKL